ncbi:MAG TPA: hypothetical protein VGL09_22080 [Methylomirabilota bacterium]|jgi:hypothetical protein
MLTALAPVLLMLGLTLSLTGLLVLASAIEHARQRRIQRQVRLTDAIHAELGAVAAPVVAKGWRGAWTVSFAAPLDRPSIVGRLLAITERVLGADAEIRDRLHIVITPQAHRARGRAV